MAAITQTVFYEIHFGEWNVLYLIKISPKFILKSPIDNNPAFV